MELNIDKLAPALIGFQADMENVVKDAINPFFKSKYATLEAILNAAKPHLKKHKLAVIQLPNGHGLNTMIIHESGQYIGATADLVIKDETPQGQGSAITYMRRYALSAALGIATEDDDDGNVASRTKQERETAPQSRPTARTASKPDELKKDPAIQLKAAKTRTITLLGMLGYNKPPKDREAAGKYYADWVFDLTGYILADKDIEAINEKLAALVEKEDANK